MDAKLALLQNAEACGRSRIREAEITSGLKLELMYTVCVEMWQRVMVHRQSRIAFRRLKRRARKNRTVQANMVRVLPLFDSVTGLYYPITAMQHTYLNDNADPRFVVESYIHSNANGERPAIQVTQHEHRSGTDTPSTDGSSLLIDDTCDEEDDGNDSQNEWASSPSYAHSPYSWDGYCTVTLDTDGTFVPQDSVVNAKVITPSCSSDFDHHLGSKDNLDEYDNRHSTHSPSSSNDELCVIHNNNDYRNGTPNRRVSLTSSGSDSRSGTPDDEPTLIASPSNSVINGTNPSSSSGAVHADRPYLDVPRSAAPRTCNHHQNWKRLRHKRGISYFVCTVCGRRWRKLNATLKREYGYTPNPLVHVPTTANMLTHTNLNFGVPDKYTRQLPFTYQTKWQRTGQDALVRGPLPASANRAVAGSSPNVTTCALQFQSMPSHVTLPIPAAPSNSPATAATYWTHIL